MKGRKPIKKGRPGKGGKGGQWADHLTEKAKSQGYPARSIYKLEEIQQKFHVIKTGDTVLDLGCAPGAWMLYAGKQVGKKGRVLGIDLKAIDIALPENITAIQDNILKLEHPGFIEAVEGFHTIMSDMAPATTGRKDVDALRSVELCRMALETALTHLAPKGNFICKIFQGNGFKPFEKEVKTAFAQCKIFKPESCRKHSKEIYIIAKGKL